MLGFSASWLISCRSRDTCHARNFPHLIDRPGVWHEVADTERAQFKPVLPRVIAEGHSVVAEVGEADVGHLQLTIVLCEPPSRIIHPYLNTTNRVSRFCNINEVLYVRVPIKVLYKSVT